MICLRDLLGDCEIGSVSSRLLNNPGELVQMEEVQTAVQDCFFFSQEVTETRGDFHSCNSRFSDSHSAGSCFLIDCQKRCFEVLKSPNNYVKSKNRHGHDSDILQAFDM